ncbi:MAG: outer membrane protein assembly factor BamB [Verrucomicrobiales bacterium]|jgi:outer membrane protein assembly factor BamB
MKCLAFAVFLSSLSSSTVHADWLQWRGPSFNGCAASDASPPTSWSGTKNVAWKLAIPGHGSGTPVIAGNDLFVVTSVDTKKKPDGSPAVASSGEGAPESVHQFVVICVDRITGKVRWQKTVGEIVPHSGHHSDHSYASASPITDGKHVWAHFGSRGTYCLTIAGDLVWSRQDLGLMETRGGFGDGSSPALYQNTLVVPWDQERGSYITALDASTGKTLWKTERPDEPTSWATPLIIEHQGKGMVLQNGKGFARGYDLKTGEEIWRATGQTTRPIPTPIIYEGMAFLASGHQGSFMGAYKLDGAKGDITGTAHEAWTLNKHTPDVASPALSQDRLYFHAARKGILSCVDAKTGKVHFGPDRIPGLREVYASPVVAGGHVYLTGRDGTVVVIKDGTALEVVATNKLGEPMDASPVVIGGTLYLRAAKHLYAISSKS